MKKSILTALVVSGLALSAVTRVLADETTVTGEGSCAKAHQTIIKAKDGDKTVTYYLTDNEVSKKFHSKVCSKSAQVKATGDVKEVDGKMELTATKIELAKD
jgi:hypothetical protein